MSLSNTLLWIVVVVLLIAVAVLAWRVWQMSRTQPRDGEPALTDTMEADAAGPSAAAARERRSTAPPPASAGGSSVATGNERRSAPPAARAGQDARPAGESYRPPRPRTSKPPPALAGNVPGMPPSTAAGPSHARSPGGSRPPPASAGGRRAPDDSDPEPARRSASSATRDVASPRHRPVDTPRGNSGAARALAQASSWAYQLQGLELAAAESAPFDLLVVDYSRDGSDEEAFTPRDVARLKRSGGARQRLVYAYISVGEAESYRYYWERAWKRSQPDWLIGENPDWRENYYVRFWSPDWRNIVFGGADSYISRIAAAGFDGIYLDRCDVYEEIGEHHPKVAAERDDIEADMVAFVTALSAFVRSTHPGFGIIMQNAEGLLSHAAVRAGLDAVAKEELLFGLDKAEKRNAADDVKESRQALDLMRRDGKAVFVVEYLDKPELRLEATGALRALRYVPYMARKDRELATLEANQPQPAIA